MELKPVLWVLCCVHISALKFPCQVLNFCEAPVKHINKRFFFRRMVKTLIFAKCETWKSFCLPREQNKSYQVEQIAFLISCNSSLWLLFVFPWLINVTIVNETCSSSTQLFSSCSSKEITFAIHKFILIRDPF